MKDVPVRTAATPARTAAIVALAAPLLLGLPLVGVHLAGRTLADYLEFPPLTRYVEHAAFAWPAFISMALFITVCVTPFVVATHRARTNAASRSFGPFPRWGVAAIVLTLIAWVVARSRIPGLSAVQTHTFIPLWLGYIVTVNALVHARSGRSPLTHDTARYLALFPMSAAYWWFFEYLNRFVQNWYYVGIDHFSPGAYVLWASLAFSTVLPAVSATRALLATFPGITAGLDRGPALRPPAGTASTLLLLAGAGLFAIGIYPDLTYPLLWISPFAIIICLQHLLGQPTIFAPLGAGDWREVWRWALAALVCGLFWETWNFFSAAKWVYSVPFVHRFEIFEMPLLGYAGYLPFGLECALAVDLARRVLPGR